MQLLGVQGDNFVSLKSHNLILLISPLIEAAWAGHLLHLSSLDVIGSTAGSLARFMQDREVELWENKRIVAEASSDEVCYDYLYCFTTKISNNILGSRRRTLRRPLFVSSHQHCVQITASQRLAFR